MLPIRPWPSATDLNHFTLKVTRQILPPLKGNILIQRADQRFSQLILAGI